MKEMTITTNHGDTFTITDTLECKTASMALSQFKQKGVLYFTVDGAEYYVPSTSVDTIKIETVNG